MKELYEGVMRLRVRPYSNARTHAARNALLAHAHHVLHYQVRGTSGNLKSAPRKEKEEREKKQEEEEEEESHVLYLVGCPLSPYWWVTASSSILMFTWYS